MAKKAILSVLFAATCCFAISGKENTKCVRAESNQAEQEEQKNKLSCWSEGSYCLKDGTRDQLSSQEQAELKTIKKKIRKISRKTLKKLKAVVKEHKEFLVKYTEVDKEVEVKACVKPKFVLEAETKN